jgi:hypothetical protein
MKKKRTKTDKELKLLDERKKKLEELLNLIKCNQRSWRKREEALGAFFGMHWKTFEEVRLLISNLSHEKTEEMKITMCDKLGLVKDVLDFSIFKRQNHE